MRAKDIDKADGPKQVDVLLTAMGGDAVKLYYTFVFAPAVAEDEKHCIAAIPAQNKDSLADVLVKFDQHYGVKRYSVKRLGLLSQMQTSPVTITSIHDQTTRVEGAVTIPITYKGDTWALTFCVLKNSTDLLGKADIVKLGLIARVNIATCESACRALVEK